MPVFSKPLRLSPEEQREVDLRLKRGIIRPSPSEYASPALVPRKRDGSPRDSINFIKLNSGVEKQHYPMLLIQDILDELAEATVFSD